MFRRASCSWLFGHEISAYHQYSCKFDSSGIGFVYPIQPFWGSLLVTYETGGVLSALQFPPPSIKVSDTIWLKDCLYLLNLMLHWCICYLGPSRFWSYGSWIYKFICNQCLSPLTLWVRIPHRRYVLDATLCDKVCQWLAVGRWFSPGTPVSSTNKTDHHNINEVLLKVALNTITLIRILILQLSV